MGEGSATILEEEECGWDSGHYPNKVPMKESTPYD